MSYYQLSAGNGPAECELAVTKMLNHILENYADVEVIKTTPGYNLGTMKSAYIKTDADLDIFCGPIQWICKSPFRPTHKRKNWFISFRKFEQTALPNFDEKQITFQTMRSSGHGGQNVNKVETAVRAIYSPTGYSTVCQDERSQMMNKKLAIERIKIHLFEEQENIRADVNKAKWNQHNSLKRGQAIAVFKGEKFKQIHIGEER